MSILKNSSDFSKRWQAFSHPNIARDWFTILTLSLIALVAIFVWNMWAFDTVANGGVFNASAPTVAPVFTQTSLDTIHGVFDARNLKEEQYTSEDYHFIDPSQ